MSRINVFDVKKSHIFYKNEGGDVVIKPNTPYFNSKLLKFDGERISHVIEPGFPHPDDFDFVSERKITVQETFNEMIFNITIGDDSVTTRPGMADNLIKNMDSVSGITKIFLDYYQETTNVELLETILKEFGERIKTIEDGWIIDDLFFVDRKGAAYNWHSSTQEINTQHGTNLGGGMICIVINKNHGVSDAVVIDTKNGPIRIDPVGYQIMSKINYLLNPLPFPDDVVKNQIPESTIEILQRQDPVQPKASGIFTQHRLDGL
tara:strand:- start:6394 stop:7182 length:789 start_codon:yes stop_codon:yes gene_type:complete